MRIVQLLFDSTLSEIYLKRLRRNECLVYMLL